MSKCNNPGAVVFRGNAWECANCGSIACAKEPFETPKKKSSWDKTCECGSNKLYGPNNKHHASWCDLYIKP